MSSEALSQVRGAARPDDLQGDLAGAIESFLVDRRVRNCTARTLETYEANLERFSAAEGWDLAACTPLAVRRYLTGLRDRMQPITIDQHFRTLRTFFTWCTASGLLADDPMRGMAMKPPKTLPLTRCRAVGGGTTSLIGGAQCAAATPRRISSSS